MYYTGKEKKIEHEGRLEIHAQSNQMALVVEHDGRPVLMVGVGKIVPENWAGKKVKITVEDLDA